MVPALCILQPPKHLNSSPSLILGNSHLNILSVQEPAKILGLGKSKNLTNLNTAKIEIVPNLSPLSSSLEAQLDFLPGYKHLQESLPSIQHHIQLQLKGNQKS